MIGRNDGMVYAHSSPGVKIDTPSVRWSETAEDKRTRMAAPATPWRPRILRRDHTDEDHDQPSPLDRKINILPLRLGQQDAAGFSPAPSSATLVPSADKEDAKCDDAYARTCFPPPNLNDKPDPVAPKHPMAQTPMFGQGYRSRADGGRTGHNDETNIYVNGLPKEMNDNMLYLLGSFCGVVISHKAMVDRHTGLCKGFGFLMFATPDMAMHAIEWLNSHGFSASFAKESFSARLRRMADASSTNVYLSNLPVKLNEAQLEQLFNPHPVASLKILYDVHGESKGVGFVRLFDRQTARTCIERLHGRILPGTTLPLQVRFADSEAQKQLKHSAQQKQTLENLGLFSTHPRAAGAKVHPPSPFAPPSTELGVSNCGAGEPGARTMQRLGAVRGMGAGAGQMMSPVMGAGFPLGMHAASPELPFGPGLLSAHGLGIQMQPHLWTSASLSPVQLGQPMLSPDWPTMSTPQVMFSDQVFYSAPGFRSLEEQWGKPKSHDPEPRLAPPRPFIPPPGPVRRDNGSEDDETATPMRAQSARKEARVGDSARVRFPGGDGRAVREATARVASDPMALVNAQARLREAAMAARVRRAVSADQAIEAADDSGASSEQADDDDSSLSIEIHIHPDATG